jgi:hypothetical protein
MTTLARCLEAVHERQHLTDNSVRLLRWSFHAYGCNRINFINEEIIAGAFFSALLQRPFGDWIHSPAILDMISGPLIKKKAPVSLATARNVSLSDPGGP